MADIEIFGKLNKEIIVRDYTGGETETANVVVNNSDIESERIIKANVKKVPHILNVKDNGKTLVSSDGRSRFKKYS